jgi:hypothetical protein
MVANSEPPTEASPLLQTTQETPKPAPKWSFQVQAPRHIVLLLALLILSLATGGALMTVPTTRILEDILCHRYYGDLQGRNGSIDEKLCKVDDIQSDLAYLNGLISALEATVGMLFIHLFSA